MELCEGGTLEDQLKNGRRFSESHLRDITHQVTSVCYLGAFIMFVSLTHSSFSQGLNHIHSLGLVHLDIKPGNIYIKSGSKSTFPISSLFFSSPLLSLSSFFCLSLTSLQGNQTQMFIR